MIPRRQYLKVLVTSLVGFTGAFFGRQRSRASNKPLLRPPGALAEDSFSDACVRCFKCASACPNDCIRFFGIEAGLKNAFTPYIDARAKGCIICGKCGEVCPSGALQPIGTTEEEWVEKVQMGKAHLRKDLCYSYHGRTCGACYRACPLAEKAMTIGMFETPILHLEYCVGCGLCEQACLHIPQAIRVLPQDRSRKLHT